MVNCEWSIVISECFKITDCIEGLTIDHSQFTKIQINTLSINLTPSTQIATKTIVGFPSINISIG